MEEIDKDASIIDFLFEVGILAKTPRSGFFFLGSGDQSVAEHVNRVVYIGFTLGMLTPNVDVGKILKMCLLHDLSETRISDLNYVHQKYTERHEHKAIDDLAKTLPFGNDILELIKEYETRKTLESKLAKDADRLEWLMALKEQYDTGNTRAAAWMPSALKKIIKTDSDRWWSGDREDEWWVSRNKKSE
jgi:putative hydrolases of HD superfamily